MRLLILSASREDIAGVVQYSSTDKLLRYNVKNAESRLNSEGRRSALDVWVEIIDATERLDPASHKEIYLS